MPSSTYDICSILGDDDPISMSIFETSIIGLAILFEENEESEEMDEDPKIDASAAEKEKSSNA